MTTPESPASALPPAHDPRAAMRRRLREWRSALPAAQRIAAGAAIVPRLEQVAEFLTDARIAGYWAVNGELPLHAAMTAALSRDQVWYLPRLHEDGRLRFGRWRPGDAVAVNRHGIPEPAPEADPLTADELDVVLVPLLGFDRRGHRLGYGGGWYDRSFSFLRDRQRPGTPILIGVGYAAQEVECVANQPWDVPLDAIVTERECIDLMPPPA